MLLNYYIRKISYKLFSSACCRISILFNHLTELMKRQIWTVRLFLVYCKNFPFVYVNTKDWSFILDSHHTVSMNQHCQVVLEIRHVFLLITSTKSTDKIRKPKHLMTANLGCYLQKLKQLQLKYTVRWTLFMPARYIKFVIHVCFFKTVNCTISNAAINRAW